MSKIITLFMLLWATVGYAQTISGKVENIYGGKIMMANLIIKDAADSASIKEFVLIQNGYYSIALSGIYTNIIVEIRANKYIAQLRTLKNIKKGQQYNLDFILQKDTTIVLDEVVVRPDTELPEPNDTTTYNVADFKNGNERKIQDIIARLPGISIDKKGLISYKGKKISTAMMDGDDLFGGRYNIGTKNINVDIIEQIQVIENYSDNPLSQGFDSDKKVALNLTFKKGKTDWSGSIDAGIGLAENKKLMHNSSANMVMMSQAYKSFALGSFNTIGQNSDTQGYDFDYNQEPQAKKIDPKAPKVIGEFVQPSQLDEERANINRSFLASYSGLVHLAKKTTLRTSLFYLTDHQQSLQTSQSDNFINNQRFQTSDSYDAQRIPTQYKADFQIKNRPSENTFIKYDGIISNETTRSFGNIVQNNSKNFEGQMRSRDFMIYQTLIYTYKISKRHIIEASANQSSNSAPQNFWLSPSSAQITNPDYTKDKQLSSFKKNVLDFEISWLGKGANKDKFRFSIGAMRGANTFDSDFLAASPSPLSGFSNRVRSQQNSIYQKGQYDFGLLGFKIKPAYMLSYLRQSLENSANIQKPNLLLEPSVTILRQLTHLTNISFQSSYSQKPLLDQNFFERPVVISNRTSINNIASLNLQRTSFYELKYNLDDTYNQFLMELQAGYFNIKGNFYNNIYFDPNITRIESFYMPLANENTTFGFSADKYLKPLKARFALKSNYSILTNKNLINTTELRDNVNHLMSHQFRIRTNLETFIDFENKITWASNSSKTQANAANKNQTINNAFIGIIKYKKRWSCAVEADYFLPNLKQKNSAILFLDVWIKYQPKDNYEIKLSGKNLTNNQNFTQISTNDFAITYFRTNLIARYVMLYFSYSI